MSGQRFAAATRFPGRPKEVALLGHFGSWDEAEADLGSDTPGQGVVTEADWKSAPPVPRAGGWKYCAISRNPRAPGGRRS